MLGAVRYQKRTISEVLPTPLSPMMQILKSFP